MGQWLKKLTDSFNFLSNDSICHAYVIRLNYKTIYPGETFMIKRILALFTITAATILLFSCDNLNQSAYELWRNSDEARDLNFDQKINEEDYEIYLQQLEDPYIVWRNSDEAEDLNGDRKIDELDYALYLNPPENLYEIWKSSSNAEDLNEDGVIDEADYNLYLDAVKIMGTYQVTNFSYEGDKIWIADNIHLDEFGQHLGGITFGISLYGEIDVQMSNDVIAIFGEDLPAVLDALDNMTFTRISPFIFSLDTSIVLDEIEIVVTIYFSEIEHGFSTQYVFKLDDMEGSLAFDLVKEIQDES
jgi:hypothetical protein